MLPLQAAAPAVSASSSESHLNIIDMATGSDPVVQLVLLLLIAFSVISWAIIFFKFGQFNKTKTQTLLMMDTMARSASLEESMRSAGRSQGPAQEILMNSLNLVLKEKQKRGSLNLDQLNQRLRADVDEQIAELESYTPFLASTASASPFIGLFGTVWGILAAFWKIGETGSSSLATVGPYIAEALIATAIGLAAAIPAVMAYNYFVSRINTIARHLDHFAADLAIKIEQEYC